MSSNRFALIIANDQYEDESFSELEAPQFDANALANVLGDPETSNFYVQLAVNKRSHTVNQLIEAFFDNRKRGDLLLLYFSGHGVKDEDGRLYFATPNTKRNRLLSTAVAASFVNDLMRKTRSRSQILLLDCCYSGAFAKGMIAKSGTAIGTTVGTNEQFQGRGRVVLTASDSMQYAFEEDKLVEKGSVNSIFTKAIVEGIRTWEADSNNDNRISIHELYDYVDGYVQERTPNQQPVMWSFNTQGEMIIAEREYAPLVEDEEIEVYEHEAQSPEEPQPPVETVQPSMELEPPPVEVVHVEIEEPLEVEQPPVETAPPSQVQISAELVKPFLEEPTDSRKFPVIPLILVVIILVAIIGISYWFGIGPFARTTEEGGSAPGMGEVPIIENFSVDDFILSWSVSNATSASIDQGIGGVALSGTTTVSPDETTTYTLVATKGDRSTNATVQIIVEEVEWSGDPVVEYFTSEGSTLSWSVTGARDVSISQGIGDVAHSGTTTVSPDETTTYTLTADNFFGRAYAFRTVVVTPSARARVVALNRGGDVNNTQLVALQQDFPNIDWVVVTGEIEESHLDSADMLIMSQEDPTWSYESREVDYIKNWLSLGDKTIWVTCDSDFSGQIDGSGIGWMRQVESNYILEEIGSSLRVESCSVEDHKSYAGTSGDPPQGAFHRVLGTPNTNYEEFLTGVSTSLFHGPGPIIGTDGSSYYDLVSSTPPSTSIHVLMTTSTDSTENGYIVDHYSEILPEYHTAGTYYKVALMAVEELGSNLVIVTGDSVYDHFLGLYKPELSEDNEIQERYGTEFPTQGDVLFSNILEYVIGKSS